MRAGRRDVQLTHPGKVLFPDDGITKEDLAAYYRDVAPRMVPLVRERPVSMQRFNDGIGKEGFFQKNVARGAPPWLKRVKVGKRGGSLWHVLANDAATLVWLANQNCITPHVWLARADRLERPDRMIFDLDPADEDDFALVRRTARELGDVLRGVRKTVAQYCAGHKATAGELTGAIATLESLYEVDPAARGVDGKSVKQVAVATQRRLRICGARSAAKRVGKLTG